MKRILKVLYSILLEIVLLPISILVWIAALAYAVWCNGWDKEEWKWDREYAKLALLELWRAKIAWINK